MDLSPFLNTGNIAALFNTSGITPSFRDLLNSIIKGATISLAQLLKNEACIPSGPHADVPEISLIASVIVASLIVIVFICGWELSESQWIH